MTFVKNKNGLWRLLSLLVVGFSLSMPALASFQLESTGIVLEESKGRVSFNITNSSSEPILLASKLADLDNSSMSKNVLISPPITRIDAGQSQQVNFVLKKGVALPHEVLLRASFEGIVQASESSARMPVRQNVGLIIQPASVAANKAPWETLEVKLEGSKLLISNTSKHVVRLSQALTLKPSGKVVSLIAPYILVGEKLAFDVGTSVTSVEITPFSRYGFQMDQTTLSVKR
ncbi:fimbria/pilus chaperone family protein [Serratia liquefaciens]|uniref:fimbria/pilus chaperone family protein n=1 Tax=Serratia liquefaciens TaxID=614 RepID=UPI00235F76E5|nr:fimbria/pilus chaperone family protein [Serratia liquefaciens]